MGGHLWGAIILPTKLRNVIITIGRGIRKDWLTNQKEWTSKWQSQDLNGILTPETSF